MRIIGFPNAAASPFWSTPVHALSPWLRRIRNSLEDSLWHSKNFPAEQEAIALEPRIAVDAMNAFTPHPLASNDEVFAPWPQAYRRLTVPHPTPQTHALRVVRESDAALKSDCAGRMVMSGKIADICAELDRMELRATRAEG